jgi:5S rRNA maturation endonuclease (ribonuclease M5)
VQQRFNGGRPSAICRVLAERTEDHLADGSGKENAFCPAGHWRHGLYEAQQDNAEPQRLLVVEGYMDVVALAQYDINYAVASLGTSTTADHIQLLFRVTNTVICCYDGDRAGRDAAWRAEILFQRLLFIVKQKTTDISSHPIYSLFNYQKADYWFPQNM